MKRFSKPTFFAVAIICPLFLIACETSGDVGVRTNTAPPSAGTWRCTGGVTLTVRNLGSVLSVSDSRGVEAELPADPPGQRERYGKTGFALVFSGQTASWFATGKAPADCRR